MTILLPPKIFGLALATETQLPSVFPAVIVEELAGFSADPWVLVNWRQKCPQFQGAHCPHSQIGSTCILEPITMPILALQDVFERAIEEGPNHPAGACRDNGEHNEEAHLVHRAPEVAEPAGDEIADEAGADPQAHRRRDHARSCSTNWYFRRTVAVKENGS